MKAPEKSTWMRKIGRWGFVLVWIPFGLLMFLIGKTWFHKIVLHQYDTPNPTENPLFWPLVIATVVLALLTPGFLVGSLLSRLRVGSLLTGLKSGLRGNQRVMNEGKQAEAEILRVEDANITVNHSPMVRLLLRVKPDGSASFEAETTTLVSRLDVHRLIPGATIRVKYLPETKEVAVVDV